MCMHVAVALAACMRIHEIACGCRGGSLKGPGGHSKRKSLSQAEVLVSGGLRCIPPAAWPLRHPVRTARHCSSSPSHPTTPTQMPSTHMPEAVLLLLLAAIFLPPSVHFVSADIPRPGAGSSSRGDEASSWLHALLKGQQEDEQLAAPGGRAAAAGEERLALITAAYEAWAMASNGQGEGWGDERSRAVVRYGQVAV